MSKKLPTIIIPAHNEEKNIYDTLEQLYTGHQHEYIVIVVCNGCTDNTIQIIKEHFPSITCKTIEIASKAHAIRHAESLTPGFPRIYLDADISLSRDAAIEIINICHLNKSPCLVVPKSKMLLSRTSFWVKLYYEFWYQTPYVTKQGYGSGVYSLSKLARLRFKEWPDMVSDDGFIRSQFSLEEINIVKTAQVLVKPPKNLRQLIKIKARSKYGGIELRASGEIKSSHDLHNQKTNATMLTSKQNFLSIINYFFVNASALVIAHYMYRTKKFTWLRDNSSH